MKRFDLLVVVGFLLSLFGGLAASSARADNLTLRSFTLPNFTNITRPIIQFPETPLGTKIDLNKIEAGAFWEYTPLGSMAGAEELVALRALLERYDFDKELTELLEAWNEGNMTSEEFIDRLGALLEMYGDIATAREANGAGNGCQYSACELDGVWLEDFIDPEKVRNWISCTRAICIEQDDPIFLFPASELSKLFKDECTDAVCLPEVFDETWIGLKYTLLKKLGECNDAMCTNTQKANPVLDGGDGDVEPVVADTEEEKEEEEEEEEEDKSSDDHTQTSVIHRYDSQEDKASGNASEVTVVQTDSTGATTSTHYAADYSSGSLALGGQLGGTYYTSPGVAEGNSHAAHVDLWSYTEGLFTVF